MIESDIIEIMRICDKNGLMNEQTLRDIIEIFEKNGIETNIRKIYKNTVDGEKIEVYTNENPHKKGKIQ